ncbi:MAG TPA: 23S rRNA (pseudouridine(1915)-N(3))-methyltransferase RlmH [Candidatus Acidoferrum sp.]|nr:23S rRNA (pseudouridine(1915)-N(3))-methyltransferase RlmH [Candidatus Acidoferrum sp.]
MRIQLIFLGKTRRPEIRALMDDYVARIRRHAEIEVRELRPDSPASWKRLDLGAGSGIVLLDTAGKKLNSEQFAEWMGACRDRGQRELIFLCGAAEGFPERLAGQASQRISLSPLTFSHELARVMLAEQIYRAFALLSGHPYPK